MRCIYIFTWIYNLPYHDPRVGRSQNALFLLLLSSIFFIRAFNQCDYLAESRNGLNMDYILIKDGVRDPLVAISCCHYFYIQDFQNPLTLKTKNHVALDTILRAFSQCDYLTYLNQVAFN